MRNLIFVIFSSFLFHSCWDLQTGAPVQGFGPGIWRGTFLLEDQVVPVIYEVLNTNNEQPTEIIFKTAQQQIKADKVRIWGDTLFVEFHKSNTFLKLVYQIDQMDGFLYDNNKLEYPIVFAGQYGMNYRFKDIRKTPTINLTGEWTVQATGLQDSSFIGSVRFAANKNNLEGTLQFQNKTIILEGTVQGDKLYLSGFDGKTVCLLSATIENSKKLSQGNLKINQESFYWEGIAVAGIENK